MSSPAASPSAAANQLRADRDRFVALAFCWADTLIELDSELTVVFAAGLTMAVTGIGPDKLIGRKIDDVLMPEHRAELRRLLGVAAECGRIDNVSIAFKGPDGVGVPVELAAHRLPDLGDQSFLAMRIGAAGAEGSDLAKSAGHGLLDEEAFIAAAKRRLSDHDAETGAVLTLLSLPELAVLRQRLDDAAYRNLSNTIAGYLKARSLERNSAARLADGRYGLVHDNDLDVERLESHLLSIVKGLEQPGFSPTIESASIKPSAALADDALGQVIVYAIRQFRAGGETGFTLQRLRDDLPKVAADAAEMANTFTRLVATKGFHIAFQPILCGTGGDLLFYEGLARIDGRNDASPSKYICYAEETGQIRDFDIAMAEKALAWLRGQSTPDLRISINISGLSMLDPDFITRLHGVLDAHADCGKRLAFEITDCSRIEDLPAANTLIQSLRQRGHLVGLDDFAAGLPGFRILSELDVDFVKFHRDAPLHAKQSPKSRALLISLTGFCRLLAVRTIATAVESADSLAFLGECGIQCVQGYLFGKPNPDIAAFRSAEGVVKQAAQG